MNARWRVPLAASAAVIVAQIARIDPLMDVVRGGTPGDVHLAWPLTHTLWAPFTLLADWLNAGSRADLKSFFVWLVVGYALWRLAQGRKDPTRRSNREAFSAASFLLASLLFVWWGVRWNRPIPRLVAADSSLILVDLHSHTSASHDGRAGFGAAANARWHARAGFDAAFVTDHNVVGAARQWQLDGAGHPPRLLGGEELSLAGLHMVVLGNDSLIRNEPWNISFDSSLALLVAVSRQQGTAGQPVLIASLPEFWEHHWGVDLGRLVGAGLSGFEVWTSSPRAMDFRPEARATLIARARLEHLALVGATDMHGLGNTASVWNVARVPGWRHMTDVELTRALLGVIRTAPKEMRVVAMRRWLPESRAGHAFAAPVGIFTALRAASWQHAAALLAWIWVGALVLKRKGVGA